MDSKSELRRTQSMKSIHSFNDKSTDVGPRDKIASVSELVARYQTAVKAGAVTKTASRHSAAGGKWTQSEIIPPPQQSKETSLESLLRRNEEREQTRAQPTLTRSVSVGSLQSGSQSVEALKARFEPKGAVKTKASSSFPHKNITPSNTAEKPVMNGEVEEIPSPAEDTKAPSANRVKNEEKNNVTQKVVNPTQAEKRKTIGGIDFETMAASQANEKRKSFAEQRDNSDTQTKDFVPISVKAISALYMSKVKSQELQQPLSPGKRANLTKMEEDSQQTRPPTQCLIPQPQVSRETLHKQRQKCELRRLLKHTHPELKTLDDVMDEEFAEVLDSEGGTAGERGYEGEVLSRCLLFENRGPYDNGSSPVPKTQMAQEGAEGNNFNKTPGGSEKAKEKAHALSVDRSAKGDKSFSENPRIETESEDEMSKIDVRATRRMFEGQSGGKCRSSGEKYQGKVSTLGHETISFKEAKKLADSEHTEVANNGKCRSTQLQKKLRTSKDCAAADRRGLSGGDVVLSDATSTEDERPHFSDSESHNEKIQTSASLFLNNPFVSTNIQKESQLKPLNHESSPIEDGPAVNVKNRTHLFESMPFHKIRHQNRDEVETLVENIKETLRFLHRAKALYSAGAIIEVNETMMAKKATFTLSENGPVINDSDVVEGCAQNLTLQLLPRTNLKPQITYLKEDGSEHMQATVLEVPHQQHQFYKETEFKTANMVQVIEDILNQDNSLRKGIILQEDLHNQTEVIVYSLFKYFDEQDVKSYSPPHSGSTNSTTVSQESSKEQTSRALEGLELRGNVKLFKDCIEKGDLEYLKSLHVVSVVGEETAAEVQEVNGHDKDPQQGQADQSDSEWVPVDVKRLKSLFSEDKNACNRDSHVPHPHIQTAPLYKSTSSAGSDAVTVPVSEVKSGNHEPGVPHNSEDESLVAVKCKSNIGIVQTEVRDSTRQVFKIQTDIQDVQQAKTETQQSLQENTRLNIAKAQRADLEGEKVDTCQQEGNHKEQNDEKEEKRCESLVPKQNSQTDLVPNLNSQLPSEEEGDGEVVLQGKLQAALESLGKSNINVSRGDFKAAMIYRNSSRAHEEKSKSLHTDSVLKSNSEEVCAATDSAQAPKGQRVEEDKSKAPPDSGNKKKPSKKCKRAPGPKPVIPPKPEHLKRKQKEEQPTDSKSSTETPKAKETISQNPQSSPVSSVGESQQSQCGLELDTDQVQVLKAAASENIDRKADVKKKENSSQNAPVKETGGTPDTIHTNNYKSCQKFDKEKNFSTKSAPAKPKRLRATQNDKVDPKTKAESCAGLSRAEVKSEQTVAQLSASTYPETAESKEARKVSVSQQGKIEIRERKGGAETESERRQRLSLHLDQIVTGNTTAAMEIFDNLRKQEQLQSLLSRVEEIEKDTSEVDVRALRKVFENIPDWVVSSDRERGKNIKEESRDKRPPTPREKTESSSAVANVYGDLERASEEFINLKEQTLARLLDIEDAIKKALYSVSALKSDSDIASLSCLFKESLGQEAPPAGTKRKMKSSEKKKQKEARERCAAVKETHSPKAQTSPPSTPSFTSSYSSVRKVEPVRVMAQETRMCSSCQQRSREEEKSRTRGEEIDINITGQKQHTGSSYSSKREMSALAVQTDSDGNSAPGTKTENYERTDNSENAFHSSKSIALTQPATITTSQAVFSPSAQHFHLS